MLNIILWVIGCILGIFIQWTFNLPEEFFQIYVLLFAAALLLFNLRKAMQ